jgi:hypothetical protein
VPSPSADRYLVLTRLRSATMASVQWLQEGRVDAKMWDLLSRLAAGYGASLPLKISMLVVPFVELKLAVAEREQRAGSGQAKVILTSWMGSPGAMLFSALNAASRSARGGRLGSSTGLSSAIELTA